MQLQDLVWLEGERQSPLLADAAQLEARADEIAGGVAMNPYYRTFAASDGFVAVACLNLAQREAFLALFALDDPTVDAPDLVPEDADVLAAKVALTAEIERAFAGEAVEDWLERLRAAGVPCGPVHMREGLLADPQVSATGLIGEVSQTGLGRIRLLGPFVQPGASPAPAPALGADTDAVLGALG